LEAALGHCRRGSDLAKSLTEGDPLLTEANACMDQLAQASPVKRKRSR
jgi:hypothetical protein